MLNKWLFPTKIPFSCFAGSVPFYITLSWPLSGKSCLELLLVEANRLYLLVLARVKRRGDDKKTIRKRIWDKKTIKKRAPRDAFVFFISMRRCQCRAKSCSETYTTLTFVRELGAYGVGSNQLRHFGRFSG